MLSWARKPVGLGKGCGLKHICTQEEECKQSKSMNTLLCIQHSYSSRAGQRLEWLQRSANWNYVAAVVTLRADGAISSILATIPDLLNENVVLLNAAMPLLRCVCINHLCLKLIVIIWAAPLQVWEGVDIHWLLNDSVICVVCLYTEGSYVAGNCCWGRLDFVLGLLLLSLSLSPLCLSLLLYPLIALFEQGME